MQLIQGGWVEVDTTRTGDWQRPEQDGRVHFLVFRQIPVLEPEITLLALAPRAFPVEVDIDALLVLVRNRLWLRVALEPRQILKVKTPRLLLEFLCGEELLVCPRAEVEHVEQRVDVEGGEDTWRAERRNRLLRVVARRVERAARHIVLGLLCVVGLGQMMIPDFELFLDSIEILHACGRCIETTLA